MKRIIKNQSGSFIEVKDVDIRKGVIVYDLKDEFVGYVVDNGIMVFVMDTHGREVFEIESSFNDFINITTFYNFYQL